jgi:hypothetical protein
MTDTVHFSETLVSTYESTRRHNPEHHRLMYSRMDGYMDRHIQTDGQLDRRTEAGTRICMCVHVYIHI